MSSGRVDKSTLWGRASWGARLGLGSTRRASDDNKAPRALMRLIISTDKYAMTFSRDGRMNFANADRWIARRTRAELFRVDARKTDRMYFFTSEFA